MKSRLKICRQLVLKILKIQKSNGEDAKLHNSGDLGAGKSIVKMELFFCRFY